MKLKIYLSLLLFSFLSGMLSQGAEHPKREFRGAWIHTVGQSRYMEMNRDAMQDYFDQMLDSLQHIGINAVIFQVRPTADAFYRSELEPWSKYLTGKQGVAPEPLWDPLQYIIEQCHARNMELHAWLNPYRVGTNADEPLTAVGECHDGRRCALALIVRDDGCAAALNHGDAAVGGTQVDTDIFCDPHRDTSCSFRKCCTESIISGISVRNHTFSIITVHIPDCKTGIMNFFPFSPAASGRR